jgi:hypothetical protein
MKYRLPDNRIAQGKVRSQASSRLRTVAAAELVAMGTIFAADNYGLPVSTTHVLSSGVAGTMAANGSGIQMVSGGGDPQRERKAKREADSRAKTFADLAEDFIERYSKPHNKSWRDDRYYLQTHCAPWGARKAKSITRGDVASLLDQIAAKAPVAANRAQSVLSRMYNWAIDSGFVEHNPLARMHKRGFEKPKDRTLTDGELRVLWPALADAGTIGACLQFLILTGLRPAEAAGIEF